MNLHSIILGVKTGAKVGLNFVKRHLPQIMVVAGVGGFVGTAVASGKAALKAQEILNEKEQAEAELADANVRNDISQEEWIEKRKQLRKITRWKLVKNFALPATLAVASGALVLGGNSMLGKRAATAAAAAYEAQKKLYEHDKAMKELLGEETAKKIQQGLAVDKEKVAEEIKDRAKAEKEHPLPSDPAWMEVSFFFDEVTCGFNGGWHKNLYSQWNKICDTYRFCCEKLRIEGHLCVNDILRIEFNHPAIMNGEHGWIFDPRGFGVDAMEWFIDYGFGRIPINQFILDSGCNDFLNKASSENSVIITFKTRSQDISKMYDAINSRHRIYRP